MNNLKENELMIKKMQSEVRFTYKGNHITLSIERDEGNRMSLEDLGLSFREMESVLADIIQQGDVDLDLGRWVYMCSDYVVVADIERKKNIYHFDVFFIATEIVTRKKASIREIVSRK